MLPADCFPRYRPPAEAYSMIVGVTSGCSHNGCTFCGMYRGVPTHVRSTSEFEDHLALAAAQYPSSIRRVFLGDGDAMSVPAGDLLERIGQVRGRFPKANRFSCYARAEGILGKTDDALNDLRAAGLRTLYLGLESGDEELLCSINKGCTAAEMVEAVQKARRCGIRMSVMALIGLAGVEGSLKHAEATADALNRMSPRFTSLLTYIPVPRSRPETTIDDSAALAEIRMVLERLSCTTIFRSDHASNALALAGNLPTDRERLLAELDEAMDSTLRRRPSWLRGL